MHIPYYSGNSTPGLPVRCSAPALLVPHADRSPFLLFSRVSQLYFFSPSPRTRGSGRKAEAAVARPLLGDTELITAALR
ncbi:hypothetical protein AAFF_G00036450 [Aldrovandia affinis]|uniref:Uncharacterized protein n=1 Tax=Aldrovandia affinis TaxID=143900 RepID=A0AAD7WGK1_9TELE|nr:hypothetical protein AAFF_G00036450 [Aldrovandia affinis]